MKLTKEQITYIENRLIKNGVTYWDIRIEMLDHLVLETEAILNEGNTFNESVNKAFVKMNWYGSLKDVVRNKLFLINTKIRKQYFNEAFKFLISLKTLIPFLAFIVCYYWIFRHLDYVIFKRISGALLLIPSVIALILYFINFLKKNKSGIITYATFYVFFSFLMLQSFIQFIQPGSFINVSIEVHKLVIFTIVVINTIFTSAGIKVYLKNKKETDLIYKKLQLL